MADGDPHTLRTELPRLLRVAADRNRREEYGKTPVRLLRRDLKALRTKLQAEGMSFNVLMEACVRGYLRDDPAVRAAIETWSREERPGRPQSESGRPRDREIEAIYDEIGDDLAGED